MSVNLSFLSVILIWSTTPLAIQWSGMGSGYLFGVTSRMFLGAVLAYIMLRLMGLALPMHRKAVQTYVAAGSAIYGAMLCVYWASQYIPSGWVSVIFGTTPIVTGLVATLWLGEAAFTWNKSVGMGMGLIGLFAIFGSGADMGASAVLGVVVMLISVVIHSVSAVWIKHIGAGLPGLSVATGGLLFSLPLYALTWWGTGESAPSEISLRTGLSILYLAAFGSVFGFAMYYYILRMMAASRVALITLVTPVLALIIGNVLNAEPVRPVVYLGAFLILAGLAFYEWGPRRRAWSVPEEPPL